MKKLFVFFLTSFLIVSFGFLLVKNSRASVEYHYRYQILTQGAQYEANKNLEIKLYINVQNEQVKRGSVTVNYDPTFLQLNSVNKWDVFEIETDTSTPGQIIIQATTSLEFSGEAPVAYLNFTTLKPIANIANSLTLNNNPTQAQPTNIPTPTSVSPPTPTPSLANCNESCFPGETECAEGLSCITDCDPDTGDCGGLVCRNPNCETESSCVCDDTNPPTPTTAPQPTATPEPINTPTPDIANCPRIDGNGPFTLVILPDKYTDLAEFESDAQKAVTSMKDTNIPDENLNKLTFRYSNNLSYDYEIKVMQNDININRLLAREIQQQCNGDAFLILSKKYPTIESSHGTGGFSSMKGGDAVVFQHSLFVVPHELGHALPGLFDEYSFNTTGQASVPEKWYNCTGDSKCQSWKDTFPNHEISCSQTCGYTNWYRSSHCSPMNNIVNPASCFKNYNPPSLKMWQDFFNTI